MAMFVTRGATVPTRDVHEPDRDLIPASARERGWMDTAEFREWYQASKERGRLIDERREYMKKAVGELA